MKSLLVAGALIFLLPAAAPALALDPVAARTCAAALARDRQSILAMAGDYDVTFNFRETVSFVEGYKPIAPKVSGGYEAVRVIENTPDSISLQHILVVGEGKDAAVVKHWRQDWVYEPRTVLSYKRSGEWALTPVAAAGRACAWSQTVWQTDDSPRYGGIGRWSHDNGVSRWISDSTLRPLARRDAVRHPVYDSYAGTNRHALTPTGWVHEQDNAKIGMKDGNRVTFVHEVVLNTYVRTTAFSAKPADDYWAATKGYWSGVRAEWNNLLARNGSIRVAEEPENGSITGPKLMELADDIIEGKTTTAKAVAEAQRVIRNPGI